MGRLLAGTPTAYPSRPLRHPGPFSRSEIGQSRAQNPLDKPLEEAAADTIASDLIDGSVHVLDRRDLAGERTLLPQLPVG
jgi:hypothetical protein